MDPESDRKISEHVLRMHRYRNPGEQDGERNFLNFSKFSYLFLSLSFYQYSFIFFLSSGIW